MGPLLVLALALAMDAFAVSLVRGSSDGGGLRGALMLGGLFGLAQGLMPLIGWALGVAFAESFRAIDHWIAFVLLAVLGLKMIREGLDDDAEAPAKSVAAPLLSLLVSALATSIDAAAAGVTLPLLGVAVPLACLAIGLTTFSLCTAGYLIGSRVSLRAGQWAELAGGVVLIGLGTKILIEHLTA